MTEVVCLKCLTLATPECTCGNLATLRDHDGHIHLYVEKIKTCRLVDVYYLHGTEVHRVLLEPFDTQLYISYKGLRSSHLNFQPYTPKNTHVKKSTKTHDTGLMNALTKYANHTAAEGRMGSTYQQPNKKDHSS